VHYHHWQDEGIGLQSIRTETPEEKNQSPRDSSQCPIIPQTHAEDEQCAICLDELPPNHDETLHTLPRCSHVFHEHCIATWLRQENTCPKCRAKTHERTEEPDVENGETRINHVGVINHDGVCATRILTCCTSTVVLGSISVLLWAFVHMSLRLI
jgi:hypothetical protein